ncbi:MAG: hypothetical protein B6244_03725 [Candidatus Cloacimonetes bacterium 4572_55]|nr:MAG: hypothetical protein B6244_03725 [Candidatus Cloacimonetes bacterium 4572_55]
MGNNPNINVLFGVLDDTNRRMLEMADEVIDFSEYDIADPDDIDGDNNTEEPDGVVDFVMMITYHDHHYSLNHGGTGTSSLVFYDDFVTNNIGYNGQPVIIDRANGTTHRMANFFESGPDGDGLMVWHVNGRSPFNSSDHLKKNH